MFFHDSGNKFPCACCGYRVNAMPPGYHETCPICGWEDDLTQLRFVNMPGSSNRVSLRKAQINFIEYGASEKLGQHAVRHPYQDDTRDDEWRPVDPAKDNIEEPTSGIDYATSYPLDTTKLYYWRHTYWRRIVG